MPEYKNTFQFQPKSWWPSLAYYARNIARRFYYEDVLLWCGGIAFKVLVAILPLSLLVFGIFGLFLKEAQILAALTDLIRSAFPGDQSAQIIEVLQNYAGASNTITIVGSIAFVLTSISLFTTLRVVLENVFKNTHVQRSTLSGYLSDLRMAFVCGILFLFSMGISFVLANVRRFGHVVLAWFDGPPDLLGHFWFDFSGWMAVLVPIFLSSTLFFLLFYLTPKPHPTVRSSILGAVFAGISWEIAKQGFALLLANAATFTRLQGIGDTMGLTALGDVFIVVVVLVFWVYYSSVILVVGGMITALRDERYVTTS